jgi:hypothetical protein
MKFLFGFDLDNTLFNYDTAFRELAARDPRLKNVKSFEKNAIKGFLRENYGERAWTEVQGIIYTGYLEYVDVDSCAINLLNEISINHSVKIMSHKSQYPAIGPAIDMRKVAMHRFIQSGISLSPKNDIQIEFFDSAEDKINRVNALPFAFFLDDLREILKKLTGTLVKGWFTANSADISEETLLPFESWDKVSNFLRSNFLDKGN